MRIGRRARQRRVLSVCTQRVLLQQRWQNTAWGPSLMQGTDVQDHEDDFQSSWGSLPGGLRGAMRMFRVHLPPPAQHGAPLWGVRRRALRASLGPSAGRGPSLDPSGPPGAAVRRGGRGGQGAQGLHLVAVHSCVVADVHPEGPPPCPRAGTARGFDQKKIFTASTQGTLYKRDFRQNK